MWFWFAFGSAVFAALTSILAKNNRSYIQDEVQLKTGILNEKGKVRWFTINLSVCATALGIIDILNDTYAKIMVEKDENSFLTGIVEIV